MSKEELLAPRHPPVGQMAVGHAFETRSAREQLYAHHLSRAAWHGARVVLRQVSLESPSIFDLIIGLFMASQGDWLSLASETNVSAENLELWLEYAAIFLGNIGNYYGRGDQKFIPRIDPNDLEKLSGVSSSTAQIYDRVRGPLFSLRPSSLGFPSEIAQSSYYPGHDRITPEKIECVSTVLEAKGIYPENTRIRKILANGETVYRVLQASTETELGERQYSIANSKAAIIVDKGDHAAELEPVCDCLVKAREHAMNSQQQAVIDQYLISFRTGEVEAFKESQRLWVKDLQPTVENAFGFVEPYRDPYGTRAEFEGIVAFVNAEETEVLTRLFNDIRQDVGFKNVMISNQIAAQYSADRTNPAFIDPSEADLYLTTDYDGFYIRVVLYELLGHGTSKLLSEYNDGTYNFDIANPPVSPLTGKPITTWYKTGQSWTGVFGDLATSLDECRAECVGAYLMDDEKLLRMFGFDESKMTPADITYTVYLQVGTAGLRALENYIEDDQKWGQAHSRGHFAMFRMLLDAGDDFLRVKHDAKKDTLTVYIDRSKLLTHGKPAIGMLLLRLHIYRCTADVVACREYFEDLTRVNGVFADWRKIVIRNKRPRQILVQANTFLGEDGNVILKEYEPTVRGMIQSWAERRI
ncbi:MAG: hypothetical protein Q9218_001989 [Villophora microphyllina]